jgi:signal transduction histidine kinase
MQNMLADGQIDLVTSAQKTAEREEKFAFSNRAIGSSSAILTVKSGDTRYDAGNYKSYSGMRVGMLRESSRNGKLVEFAKEKGFTYKPVYFDSDEEMTAALQKGTKIDALLSSNLRRISGEWILDQFAPSDFYVMVRKDETELLEEINTAITKMDTYTPQWREDLWRTYYQTGTASQTAFTQDERKYLADLKKKDIVLDAIMQPDRAPYSYFENGRAKGIIPAIFAKIEQQTGIRFNIIETKNRADYFSELDEKKAAVCMDAFFYYSDAEKKGYKLTNPYLTATISEIRRKNDTGTPASVAMVRQAGQTVFRKDILSGSTKIVYYDTIPECAAAVKNKEADAAYVYTYSAQLSADSDVTGALKVTLLPQYHEEFAIAVRDTEDSRLLTILDKAVDNIDTAFVQQTTLDETNTAGRGKSLLRFLYQDPILMVIIFTIAGLLIGLLALVFYRQKSVQVLAAKNVQLAAAVQQANEASEAKSVFLSTVSHDMRTPLNGVSGFMGLAMKAQDDKKRDAYLKMARDSCDVLVNLVNDTLEISRIENGKIVLRPEFVRSGDVFDSIITVIGNAADEKGIHFEAKLLSPTDEYVKVDKLKLQEVLMNLLTNAVKYTPAGGSVWFTVEKTEPDADGRNFRIIVKDSGIGISKEFQPKIYDAFAQEQAYGSSGASGTGLGLYIVRRIVTLMNGTINLVSEKGEGSMFTLCLPAEVRKEEVSAEKQKVREDYHFEGKKILLCEDNYFNTEIARALLKERGAEVICAGNGEEGAKIFAASAEKEIPLILMDIHMPVMGGYEATRRIRSMDRADAKTVQIIAMTADAYEEDVRKCLEAGMNGHLAKPIDPVRLYEMLAMHLAEA